MTSQSAIPEDAEWCTATSFVPIWAWDRVKSNPDSVAVILKAVTTSLAAELQDHFDKNGETEWNIDQLAHYGPERDVEGLGRGVMIVLRAWRRKS